MNRFISLLVVLFFVSSFNRIIDSDRVVLFHQNPNGEEVIAPMNADFEIQLLKLINQKRQNRGLGVLQTDEGLMRDSRYHAADMANENYHEHATHNRTSSGLQVGISTFKRISKFYEGFANTENIAAGYNSPEEVLKGWMKSPGHKRNLFNKSATHMGVGYYHNANSKFKNYWVFESAAE